MQLEKILRLWNSDLLKDDEIDEVLSPDIQELKWLGKPPALHAAIKDAEKRLGVSLPPSYKEFLQISNGWEYPGNDSDFPGPLRPVERICWFRDEDQDWINAFVMSNETETPDNEYFVYGEDQDPAHVRVRYLDGCLKISESSEGGVYLLNPAVISKTGEWEAWHFSNELPGATRCRSFRELIKCQVPRAGVRAC